MEKVYSPMKTTAIYRICQNASNCAQLEKKELHSSELNSPSCTLQVYEKRELYIFPLQIDEWFLSVITNVAGTREQENRYPIVKERQT